MTKTSLRRGFVFDISLIKFWVNLQAKQGLLSVRRNFSLSGKGEIVNVGFPENYVALTVDCIFIDGSMGQYFTLPVGMDDLCGDGF